MQHRIAGQAEDVIDAVVLAPRHRLGPAVVAVAPEGKPGARPVPADAPRQVLEHGADLDPRRRLAGAQENRHRPAALDMVDVHRQEAAGVVEGVEQRELLVAVHRVAGLVDVQHDRRRRDREGAAEDVDQGGRQARHLSARGRVLEPAHGGLRTQIAPALRRPADRQLEQRIGAQVVAIVGVLVAAGDREHTEPEHRRQRVNRPRRIAPFPDAARQRPGEAEPAFRRAQQHQPAVGRDRPAREIGGHLLALYGWKIEREKGIFGHGGRGAFVASAEMRWETNFYPNPTPYATSATMPSDPDEYIRLVVDKGIVGLTPHLGSEFVHHARSDKLWKTALKKFGDAGMDAALSRMFDVLTNIALE